MMDLHFHDAKPGKLDRCQISNRDDLININCQSWIRRKYKEY